MSSPPKVSVFMPAYNHAAYLPEAIESVLQQDYPNIHLYIGDDASTDNSRDVIKDYSARNPGKITYYINEKNRGVTRNANKLLAMCDGIYVAFTSGDDLFFPGKISRQVAFMEQHPGCVLSYTNATIFGANIADTPYYGTFPARKTYETRNGDLTAFMKHRNFIAGCTAMARRNMLPEGLYNPEVSVMSDWLFFTEIASRGDVCYINAPLSGYRRHENSLTTRYTAINDFEKTYTLAYDRFPTFRKEISAGLARLYLSYCGYYLLKRQYAAFRLTTEKLWRILSTNPSISGFLIQSFIADCARYMHRLLYQGWKL